MLILQFRAGVGNMLVMGSLQYVSLYYALGRFKGSHQKVLEQINDYYLLYGQ